MRWRSGRISDKISAYTMSSCISEVVDRCLNGWQREVENDFEEFGRASTTYEYLVDTTVRSSYVELGLQP